LDKQKMSLIFEWDENKALTNLKKHDISFEEASTAFGDLLSLTIDDIEHSEVENRFILIGKSIRDNVLVVVHLEETDTKIRIISARKATKHEQQIYER
jgi:hypothetical protein